MDATILLPNLKATQRYAYHLGQLITAGQVIALEGSVGVGKTTFIRSLAQGAKVYAEDAISSPTYNLIHIYEGPHPIYHADFYRLSPSSDLRDLGLEEGLQRGTLVIEWLSQVQTTMFTDILHLGINFDSSSPHTRLLEIRARGLVSQALCTKWLQSVN